MLIPKLIADFVWSSNINPKAKLKAFPLKELIKLLIKSLMICLLDILSLIKFLILIPSIRFNIASVI